MIELCEPHFLQMDDKLLAGCPVVKQFSIRNKWQQVENGPSGAATRWVLEGTNLRHRDDLDGVPQPAYVCDSSSVFFKLGRPCRSDAGPEFIVQGQGRFFKPLARGSQDYIFFNTASKRDSAVILAVHGGFSLVRFISSDGEVRYQAGCRNFSLQQAMQHWKGSPRKSFINALKREFFNFSLEQVK